MKTKLTKAQLKTLGKLLKKVHYPFPKVVFDWWVDRCPTMALELGIVRQGKRGPEIFMVKRGPKDPVWPNEWHIPGTVIRNERISVAYKRLIANEATGAARFGQLQFVANHEFPKGEGPLRCRRGFEYARIYVVETKKGTTLSGGKFFRFNRLPKRVIGHHETMLNLIEVFLRKEA